MNEESGAGPTEGVTIEVPATLSGVRVDRGVAMVADVSRAVAAELVEAGRVLLDGAAVASGRVPLREGSVLTVRLPEAPSATPAAEPGVRFAVVHADNDVAVIDKPAGLVVHPGAGHAEAGYLCVYQNSITGANAPDNSSIFNPENSGYGGTGKYGFALRLAAPATGSYLAHGSWAVTAP